MNTLKISINIPVIAEIRRLFPASSFAGSPEEVMINIPAYIRSNAAQPPPILMPHVTKNPVNIVIELNGIQPMAV
jgi:hypothetical protein